MIPSVVSHQVRRTILDYLRTTFDLADKGFEQALFLYSDVRKEAVLSSQLERFLHEQGDGLPVTAERGHRAAVGHLRCEMEFRIADTFTDSLTKLSGEQHKAVKTTAFDLQLNLANPGMQFYKLEWVRGRPRIVANLASERRMPFNQEGIFRRYPEFDAD